MDSNSRDEESPNYLELERGSSEQESPEKKQKRRRPTRREQKRTGPENGTAERRNFWRRRLERELPETEELPRDPTGDGGEEGARNFKFVLPL